MPAASSRAKYAPSADRPVVDLCIFALLKKETMGFDRNTVIGFVLLGLMLFLYLYLSTKSSHELEAQRKHIADSVAVVQKAREAAAQRETAVKQDSTVVAPPVDTTGFNPALKGTEQWLTVENDLIKVKFS